MGVQSPSRLQVQNSIQVDLLESRESRRRLQPLFRTADIWIPSSILAVIALACFVWPLLYRIPSPINSDILQANLRPFSPGHILGTDPLGNDIMSRILYGGRVSLEVGLGATALGLLVGGALGMTAGYRGGVIDSVIMRILDVFLAFPSLVLAIVIASALGPSEIHVIWAISFFSIPAFARLSRAGTLRLREQNFISSARLCGTRDVRIIVRHVVPNVFPSLLTFALLGVAIAIIVEAALSFLGLGVPPPGPSWGNMIQLGQQYITQYQYLVLIPSSFLFVTVLSLNLLGDAIRARWGMR